MTHTHVDHPDLVTVLRDCGALLQGDFELKSGRRSRYFIDFGRIPNGDSLVALGRCYAEKIANDFGADAFDLIFGPAYKAIPIAVATVMALAADFGMNKEYAFDRKIEKTYGEKSRFIGGKLEDGKRVLIIDDVFTDGKTKLDTIDTLQSEPGITVMGVVVGVDRSEDPDLVARFQDRTGLTLRSLCTIEDIHARLQAARVAA